MGPHLSLADVDRPVGVEHSALAVGSRLDALARPVVSPDQTPPGGFREYLEDARSLQEVGRSERPEESARPDEGPCDDTGERPVPPQLNGERDGQTAEPKREATVSAPIAGNPQLGEMPTGQSPAGESQEATEGARQVGAADSDAAETARGQGLGVKDQGSGEVARPAVAELGAKAEPNLEESASFPRPRGLKPTALLATEKTSELGSKQPPSPVEPATTPLGQEGKTGPRKDSRSSMIVEPSSVRQDPPGESGKDPWSGVELRSGAGSRSGATVGDDTPKVSAKPEGHTDEARPPSDRETIHDVKVKESIEQRRQGSPDSRGPRTGTDGSNDRGGSGQGGKQSGETENGFSVQRAKGHTVQHAARGYLEAVADSKPTFVRGAFGDRAAASVARFMLAGVEGSSASDGATGGALHGAVRGQAASGLGATGSASSGLAAVGGGTEEGFSAQRATGGIRVSGISGLNELAGAARVLSASNGSGRFHVTMQLHPPELGQLKLQIQMHLQAMTLHVDVQSRSVARLIESRLSELHDALAAHGIRVDRADVVVRSPTTGDTNLQQQDGGQNGGDEAGHQAGEQSGAWTSDGERMETARDQDPSQGDVVGELGNDAREDSPAEQAVEREVIGVTQAAELSVDLVA